MVTRSDLVDWVQARIDEFSPLEQSATIPQLIIERELDESALQVSRKAKKQLVYPAGVSLATQTCFISKKVDGTTLNSVIIPLGADFLRFLRVRLKGWTMPMDDLVSVDTNMYRHQFNQYQTATIGRPSAAIIPFSITVTDRANNDDPTENVATIYNQALELFPAPTAITGLQTTARTSVPGFNNYLAADAATIGAGTAKGLTTVFNVGYAQGSHALIDDLLVVEKTAADNMPNSLIDPIVWLAASRCLTSLRMPNEAQAASVQYQFVLDQLLVGMKGEEVQVGKRG